MGLFQISEKWWCEHGSRGKGCDMKCEGKSWPKIFLASLKFKMILADLLDDNLDDDIKCVKRIFKEHEGLSGNGYNAW